MAAARAAARREAATRDGGDGDSSDADDEAEDEEEGEEGEEEDESDVCRMMRRCIRLVLAGDCQGYYVMLCIASSCLVGNVGSARLSDGVCDLFVQSQRH